MNTMQLTERGQYGELKNIEKPVMEKLNQLFAGVKNAAKIDEHGWDFGILESNYRKGRIHTINYDYYAYGYDMHDGGLLAVIQIREYYRRKAAYFPQIRKSYFLIGQNEDGRYFAHPVSANTIHAAIKAGKDVVKAVQSWIFGTDYAKVIRQGDICLVPSSRKGAKIDGISVFSVENSHIVECSELYENNDSFYIVNPTIKHKPGTHPTVKAKGTFRLVVGKRAHFWSFAKPTID